MPRDLETICLKCLRKEPAKRYASAEALAEDLRRSGRGGQSWPGQVGPAIERTAKWVLCNPVITESVGRRGDGGGGRRDWYLSRSTLRRGSRPPSDRQCGRGEA